MKHNKAAAWDPDDPRATPTVSSSGDEESRVFRGKARPKSGGHPNNTRLQNKKIMDPKHGGGPDTSSAPEISSSGEEENRPASKLDGTTTPHVDQQVVQEDYGKNKDKKIVDHQHGVASRISSPTTSKNIVIKNHVRQSPISTAKSAIPTEGIINKVLIVFVKVGIILPMKLTPLFCLLYWIRRFLRSDIQVVQLMKWFVLLLIPARVRRIIFGMKPLMRTQYC